MVLAVSSFFIWLFITAPFSAFPAESLVGASKYLCYFIFFLGLTFLINKSKLDSHKIITFAIFALVAFSFLVSAYGIYQFFTDAPQLAKWDDPNFLSAQTRVYSIFKNPNLLGSFLLVALPLNYYLLVDSYKNLSLKFLPFISVAFLVNLACLFFTGSRSSILSFLLVMVSIAVSFVFRTHKALESKNRKLYTRVFVLFIAIAIVTFFYLDSDLITRLFTVFNMDYSTNSYRLEIWQNSIELIKENWFLGIGLGSQVFPKVFNSFATFDYEVLSAYSIYLELMVEAGLIALLLFITMLFKAFKKLLNIYKFDHNIALFIASSITALLIQGFFDTIFFRLPIQLIFWFLMAAIVTLDKYYKEVHGK